MDDEIRYPICPHRNVPAAFQRFLGSDSGGFARFFPDERAQRVDGTLLMRAGMLLFGPRQVRLPA